MGTILAIYGVGGLGREVLELSRIINSRKNRWDEFIFIDDGDVPAVVSGLHVYKYDEAKKKYPMNMEIAMGVGEPATRKKLFDKVNSDGINTPTLIHPDVYIPESTKIGTGTIIQYGCFISCNVTIEDYVYIQPHVNIGHDDVLKEGCMISGMGNIGGAVTIGKYSYIGLSSCVIQGTSIGDYSIVSIGAAVYKDIPDEMIAMGNPARPMKRNEEHRVFK